MLSVSVIMWTHVRLSGLALLSKTFRKYRNVYQLFLDVRRTAVKNIYLLFVYVFKKF